MVIAPWWRAVLFLIPIIAVSVWLSLEVIRVARVTYQVDTVSIPDIQKALRQDPDNPDLIHRLGVVYSSDPTDINLSEAVKYLRKAVALNPRRWDYWSDLGTTCDFAGDTACSDEAFERAVALNPMTPAVQWALGNHYLLTNRQEKAFPYFRRLLDMDPNYLDATFRLCLRATRDPQAIYTEVVPHGKDASARFAFLMFLSSIADYESAMRIWGQMISGPDRSPRLVAGKALPGLPHRPQSDSGCRHGLERPSARWSYPAGAPIASRRTFSMTGVLRGRASTPDLTGALSDSPDLVFDFSDPSAYQGAKCLRIDFAVGRNADYDLVNQVVLH